MNNLFYYWFIVAFLFLIFELGHPGLFLFLSFCIGAIAAAIASLFFYSFVVQSGAFLTGTVVALVFLRYWVVTKQGAIQCSSYRTNIYALQGKKGKVLNSITPGIFGKVKIGGEVWSAKSDEEIKKGVMVEIVAISGVHVVVKKVIEQ